MSIDVLEEHSRCLHGAVMGHIGTVKSMISELTDETNVTQGFSMPQLAWSLGSVIGFVLFPYSRFLADLSLFIVP